MTPDEKHFLLNQVQTDVSLISFLSVVSIFFIGALLPQFGAYDLSVKIPISFLIVATFAFLFSALILANASQAIISGDTKKIEKHLDYGYAISEYLGIFLLVLSVPIAMSIVTEDIYIRVVTFIAAILGLIIYQFGGMSILEHHFSKSHKLFSGITVVLGIVLFASHLFNFYFTLFSLLFLVYIIVITALAPNKRFQ